ncbi:MAG: bacillithiol biosynthesis BshC, partial [Candidatus Heimdallarchaeota archaeon]
KLTSNLLYCIMRLSILNEDSSSLLEIYRTAAIGHPSELSKDLWGEIPTSFRTLRKITKHQTETLDFTEFSENIEVLRHLVTERHRKMGTLTEQVRDALNHLDQGFLDVGHQPLLFGGPLFLINKISLAEWVGNLLNVGAFFFIGDHDSIQNELTIARFPQANSQTGLVITPSSWGVPEGTPMHKVPVPKAAWFQEIKPKIQDNLRSLMKSAKIRLEYRQLLLERFYSWFDLIYDQATTVEDFSTWTQKIWSQLFNIRNNLGIFLGPTSEKRYRQLILPAFEFLLTENNRYRYVEALNSVYDILVSKNIQPGLPHREEDYVPFFLECLTCKTKTRVELKVETPGTIKGKCPICTEEFSFSYDTNHPDLSEIGDDITPRSDTRAVVNNITFPLLVHIGGAGETQYYSTVIPAMKRLKVSPPVLIRSNRIYYNTPWAEKSARDNDNPMLTNEVYSIFNEFNTGIETESVRAALEKMRNLIQSKYEKEITQLNKQQAELITQPQNHNLRKQIKRTEIMLSHNFGRYVSGKDAQEVTWNWLDLAVLTGIHSICDTFRRQLKEEAFPGYTWYITAGKFS